MRLALALLLLSSSAYALEMRDAVVHVELHDRSGRVQVGNGMFTSDMGEFAVLKSIMDPAIKKPYDYLLSFTTADGRPLTGIKFSHCEEDAERGLCFYKANYVPYRKVSLTKKLKEKIDTSNLFYHQMNSGTGHVKVQAHPNQDVFWATASTSDGRIPGTLLLDNEGKPKAIVTSKRLNESNLAIPLPSLGGAGQASKSKQYNPIEQQDTNTIPKHEQEVGANMSRMVADVSRMSEEQIKKAIEALFVPGQTGARAGLGKKQTNNHLRKNLKEEVVMQEASRGEEARKEFFKIEQKAIEAQNQLKLDEKELGLLEKKLKGKEAVLGIMEMKADAIKQQVTQQTVKMDLNGSTMNDDEKKSLASSIKSDMEKLAKAEGKAKKALADVEKLKQEIESLKRKREENILMAKKLGNEASEAAKKNASAIQGTSDYRGDLL